MSRVQLSDRLRALADDLLHLNADDPSSSTIIDKWAVARRSVPCLVGIPTKHPHILDSTPLFTSELYYIDPKRSIARTFSRWYELGEQVDPSYWEQRYSRQR